MISEQIFDKWYEDNEKIFHCGQYDVKQIAYAAFCYLRKKPYIVCAAIWYNDKKKRELMPCNIETGIVVCGWRHGNCIAILHELFPNREYIINNKDSKTTIQGFLTSDNKFVNREEAGRIAFNAGQINKKTNCLFSEELY